MTESPLNCDYFDVSKAYYHLENDLGSRSGISDDVDPPLVDGIGLNEYKDGVGAVTS